VQNCVTNARPDLRTLLAFATVAGLKLVTFDRALRLTGCGALQSNAVKTPSRLPVAAAHPKSMRYIAFATDYDGTLASDGRVNETTLRALEKLKASGRKLVLATGRHLGDLQKVFPETNVFDRIVAENGAVLFDPASNNEKVLTEAPPEALLAGLRDAGVQFDVGRAIISSWTPSETAILEVIRRLALDYQVIFNKGAVMALPSGVNKATGLHHALLDLQLSLHNTVAIGDAENDHSFLAASECGVAVGNAVPALRERADIITKAERGAGVVELIDELVENDLESYDGGLQRSSIGVGYREDQETQEIYIVPNRNNILVAGASASGKSSAVAGILEELAEKGYQFCLIDPEGDFEHFAGALSIGNPKDPPDAGVIAKALEGTRSIIVNLMGVPLRDRPAAFGALLPNILEMRARTSRPHWLVIDEAHHLMPPAWSPASNATAQQLGGTIFITVHPEHVSPAALAFVDVVIATGNSAEATLTAFAKAASTLRPAGFPRAPESGEALVWFTRKSETPILVKTRMAKSERRRHRRNYAQGELSPEQSFYFRGPESKLNLRAQNLVSFIQMADGVDDETWLFHLRRGDYATWFESIIKDNDLAAAAREVGSNGHDGGDEKTASESRAHIRAAIESRYTAPV
jgi:hydroxymethylpyrimidine pyrophosphatase-like HAD family hydrolase